ncbi:60 kDa lysophospholipase-like [Tribolium madens]|uniref:60 kDa lysophospholipase-like n=1 Tax=Tribolium madens TaxID=41895 RepID=UPI001CF7235B|nr:60 kDa lysophospholipase-like [Tribolium madens]
MKPNDAGAYVPVPKEFINRLKSIPQLFDPELANAYFPNRDENDLVLPESKCFIVYKLREYDPLLDSSSMTPNDWIKIAKDIEENYGNFDGFVILHGTDTLAYTSSVLSFMIEGLQKPIIVTGAQISIYETRSDAMDNILGSLILSGCYKIPEVCVFFANKLFRGNRTTKISVKKFAAFDSPNYDILAKIQTLITLNNNYIRKPDAGPFKVNTNLNTNVGILTFFPTMTPSMLKLFLQPFDGIVIRSYGSGNIPSNQPELIQVLKNAIERGLLIINTTQCLEGAVSGIYETGKILEDIGVISGYDMTPEAAFTKLSVVLAYPHLSQQERIQMMKSNIRGELTSNYTYFSCIKINLNQKH